MTLWERFKWACKDEGGWISATILAGGAVAGAVGGGLLSAKSAKQATKLSSQEKRAYDQQYQQIEAAKRFQQLMQPFILEQLGLEAVNDENGNMVGVQRKEVKTPGEQLRDRITLEAGTQAERALKGQLPMDPATERDIRMERLRLGDQVRRTFGPAGDLSVGGRRALSDLAESESIRRARFNREQLSQLEGIFTRGLGDPQSERLRLASAMSGMPRNVMDFAQIMGEGPFAQGASDRYGARQDAQAYAHLGNILGRGIGDVTQSIVNRYRGQGADTSVGPAQQQPSYSSYYGGSNYVDPMYL